jgi:uncharacterized membrane protein
MRSKIASRIMDAAICTFARTGYHGTSTKELAVAAEVTEGSVFRLFHSKENLFKEALKKVAATQMTTKGSRARVRGLQSPVSEMTTKSPSRAEVANPTNLNVEAIARLEHEALPRRNMTERASDEIVKLVGSIAFLLLQVLLVLTWSAINLNLVSVVKPFDPFPFGILALVISSESVFLRIFVLISQNRMMRQAERRSHLDLQVGMLAEQELTTMLQMQHKICRHLGIDVESAKHELKGFSDATDVSKLASELEDKLPGE